jgi:hypothetical protein
MAIEIGNAGIDQTVAGAVVQRNHAQPEGCKFINIGQIQAISRNC